MINVMIVEDEMLVRLGMKMCVDEYCANMKVTEAFASAEEALECLEKSPADVLITDIRLTGMSGLELIERIRPVCRNMLIIVLSCYEDFSYAREAYDLGVDKYLLKHELVEDDLPRIVLDLYDKKLKQKKQENVKEKRAVVRQQTIADGIYQIAYITLRQNKSSSYVTNEEISYSMVSEIIQEILNINHLGACYLRHETMLFCIFSFERNASEIFREEKLNTFYESIKKNIKNVFDKEVYMSLSDDFLGLNEVQKNFEEAKARNTYAFYYPEGMLLRPVKSGMGEIFLYPAGMEALLAREGEADFGEYLRSYIDRQKKAGTPPEDVKVQVVRFIHELESFLYEHYGIEMETLFNGSQVPNYIKVENFCFAQPLAEWLTDVIAVIKKYIKKNDIKETVIVKVKQYIEDHYDKPMNLSEIAEAFHMNTVYFCQFFKKETGDTFVNYLNHYRIKQAKKLLKSTNDTIEVIAEKVGIENPNYFFRLFKKITGTTVGEYRKN